MHMWEDEGLWNVGFITGSFDTRPLPMVTVCNNALLDFVASALL